MPELSVIIVNWNSCDYLRQCLRTIYMYTHSVDFEIVVVDNASSEDVGQIVADFPEAVIIRSDKNLGFAGANNLGFERSSGRYLLFLNPDTEILGPAIPTMLKQLKSQQDGGVMGCKILNSDGSVQTSCVQRFPTIANQLLDSDVLRDRWPQWKIWGIQSLFSNLQTLAKVEVISGACLMIKREAFAAAGMFNREYFMYAEDVDLCFEVRRLGWSVYCTNEASIVHHGGGTSISRKGNAWIAVMQRQAIQKFCKRTRGALYAELYRLMVGIAAVLRLVTLSVLFPFRRSETRIQISLSSFTKWIAVMKWAFGIGSSVSNTYEST